MRFWFACDIRRFTDVYLIWFDFNRYCVRYFISLCHVVLHNNRKFAVHVVVTVFLSARPYINREWRNLTSKKSNPWAGRRKGFGKISDGMEGRRRVGRRKGVGQEQVHLVTSFTPLWSLTRIINRRLCCNLYIVLSVFYCTQLRHLFYVLIVRDNTSDNSCSFEKHVAAQCDSDSNRFDGCFLNWRIKQLHRYTLSLILKFYIKKFTARVAISFCLTR